MGLRNVLHKLNIKPSHFCLKVSEAIYKFFSVIDFLGQYKINIVLSFYGDIDYGHAWVTRNNKNFLLKNRSIDLSDLTEIGQNDKYRYYIVSSEF